MLIGDYSKLLIDLHLDKVGSKPRNSKHKCPERPTFINSRPICAPHIYFHWHVYIALLVAKIDLRASTRQIFSLRGRVFLIHLTVATTMRGQSQIHL